MKTAILLFSLLTTVFKGNAKPYHQKNELNNRPTIAILAQLENPQSSYIAASYVKFIESAGGRAVLIPTSFDQSVVAELFSYVNGVLYPGGGVAWFTSAYYKNAKIFYDLAIQANKNGDYFPIWGTCLGFQALHVLTANSSGVLSKFDSDDIPLPLNFTEEASSSRMFENISPRLYKILAAENVTYNHHSYGVAPDEYKNNPSLDTFYKILSTNYDKKGKEFISMIEG